MSISSISPFLRAVRGGGGKQGGLGRVFAPVFIVSRSKRVASFPSGAISRVAKDARVLRAFRSFGGEK